MIVLKRLVRPPSTSALSRTSPCGAQILSLPFSCDVALVDTVPSLSEAVTLINDGTSDLPRRTRTSMRAGKS